MIPHNLNLYSAQFNFGLDAASYCSGLNKVSNTCDIDATKTIYVKKNFFQEIFFSKKVIYVWGIDTISIKKAYIPRLMFP